MLRPERNPIPQGSFAGRYSGADVGAFQVHVNGNGLVTGTVQGSDSDSDSDSEPLGVMGKLDDEDGSIMFMASGKATTVIFMGRFDPRNSQVSDSWKHNSRDAGGTFTGQRN